LDNKQLGYSIAALLEITLSQRTAAAAEQFLDMIRNERQVIACHMVTGDCDFVLRILSPDIDSYRKLIWESLHAIDGVQRIRSSIILDTFKDQLSPTLGDRVAPTHNR
jgi:DNA-binding Lrp family transcriptional regulator